MDKILASFVAIFLVLSGAFYLQNHKVNLVKKQVQESGKEIKAVSGAVSNFIAGSGGESVLVASTITDIGNLTATDSNFIVGNGTTWVAESGATARTSMGLGTGDSPSFTAVVLSTSGISDGEVDGDLTISGGTVNNSAIGATTPSTGAFTTLSNTGTLSVFGGVTSTSTWTLTNATLIRRDYPAFRYGTTTNWVGTTTVQLAPSYVAETWNGTKCNVKPAGTLTARYGDGTNYMEFVVGSTTVGTFTLVSNNTFTASELREVQVGSPTGGAMEIACSLDKTINL